MSEAQELIPARRHILFFKPVRPIIMIISLTIRVPSWYHSPAKTQPTQAGFVSYKQGEAYQR